MPTLTSNVKKGAWFTAMGSRTVNPIELKVGTKLVIPPDFELFIIQNDKIIADIPSQSKKHSFKLNKKNIPELETRGLLFKKAKVSALLFNNHPNFYWQKATNRVVELQVSKKYRQEHNLPLDLKVEIEANYYVAVHMKQFNVLEVYKMWKDGNIRVDHVDDPFFQPAKYASKFFDRFLSEKIFDHFPGLIDTKNNNVFSLHSAYSKSKGTEPLFEDLLMKYLYNAFDGLGFTVKIEIGGLHEFRY